MNREKINSNLLLLLTSTIWGFGFVAQELGGEHLGPNAQWHPLLAWGDLPDGDSLRLAQGKVG